MIFFDYKFLILLGLTLVIYFIYREVEHLRDKVNKLESAYKTKESILDSLDISNNKTEVTTSLLTNNKINKNLPKIISVDLLSTTDLNTSLNYPKYNKSSEIELENNDIKNLKFDNLDLSSMIKNEPGEKVLTFSSARLSEKSKDFLDNEPASFESLDSKSSMLLNNLSFTQIINEPYQAKLDKLDSLSLTKNEPGEKVLTFSSARLSEKSKDFLDNEPSLAKLEKLDSLSLTKNEPTNFESESEQLEHISESSKHLAIYSNDNEQFDETLNNLQFDYNKMENSNSKENMDFIMNNLSDANSENKKSPIDEIIEEKDKQLFEMSSNKLNEASIAKLDKLNSSSMMMNEPEEKVLTFSLARLSEKSKDFLDNEPDLNNMKLLEIKKIAEQYKIPITKKVNGQKKFKNKNELIIDIQNISKKAKDF
jgi:hypothetical protein